MRIANMIKTRMRVRKKNNVRQRNPRITRNMVIAA